MLTELLLAGALCLVSTDAVALEKADSLPESKETMTIRAAIPSEWNNVEGTRWVRCVYEDIIREREDEVIDSVQIVDGSFTLTIPVDKHDPRLATLKLSAVGEGDYFSMIDINLITEPGEVTITHDSVAYYINGATLNNEFTEQVLLPRRDMLARMREINRIRNKNRKGNLETPAQQAYYNQLLTELNRAYTIEYAKYVKKHIHKSFGSTLFLMKPFQSYEEADREFLVANCDKEMLQRVEERERRRRERQEYFVQSAKAMRLGAHYRDIAGQRPDGTPVKLSELITPGRVTLLDFWASWCVPCQAEIPELKELYAKHHDKGFDIVSISLDKSEKAWQKAVERNAMPWAQMSDLKAWDGPVSQDYGIHAIPFVLLLDRNGNICMVNLHSHLLREAIEKAIND